MDTFIVRIYRRTAGGTREPAGTVEHVESGRRIGFADSTELMHTLLARDARPDTRTDSSEENS
jgi:hypothetical protein